MELPHVRQSLPLLPSRCWMGSISTLVVHSTKNARNPQLHGAHTMAALVHGACGGARLKSRGNGLATCTCTVPHHDLHARCSLTKPSSYATIVGSSILAIHQHHTATALSLHLGRIVLQLHSKRTSNPSLTLRQGCKELGCAEKGRFLCTSF